MYPDRLDLFSILVPFGSPCFLALFLLISDDTAFWYLTPYTWPLLESLMSLMLVDIPAPFFGRIFSQGVFLVEGPRSIDLRHCFGG